MKNSDSDDDLIADINMTPLIDIMLVLLIIFMVSSSVSLESGLDIDLPGSKSTSTEKSSSAVLVSIKENGETFINGQKVAMDNFVELLKASFVTEKTTTVIIEGDKASNLGHTVELMDLSKLAGATKFAIATEASN